MRFKLIFMILTILYTEAKDEHTALSYGNATGKICPEQIYSKQDVANIAGNDLYYFRQRTLKKMLYYGQRYNIPDTINIRLVYAESRFNNDVPPSSCGAKYLYQISPLMFRYYNSIGITDPSEMGCHFLRQLKDQYGTWTRALKFYNSGHADSRHKGVIKFANFITQINNQNK